MPRRPPKKWFYRTVAAIRKDRQVDDPEAVASWVWYHHARKGTKARILKREELERLIRRYKHKAVHKPKRKAGKMDGRKKRRGRRVHGFEGGRRKARMKHMIIMGGGGFEGGRRRRRRRMSGFDGLLGGLGGPGMVKGLMAGLVDTAIAVGGGIGGSVAAAKFLSETMNPKIKAAIPMAAGLVLAGMRQRMIAQIGRGLAIVGGLSLAKQFLPATLPVLAGAEDTTVIGPAHVAGALEDFSGAEDIFAQGDTAQLADDSIEGADEDIFRGDEIEGDDLEGDDGIEGIDGDDLEGAEVPFITQANM